MEDLKKKLQECEKLASEYYQKMMFAESEIEFESAEAALKSIAKKIEELNNQIKEGKQ